MLYKTSIYNTLKMFNATLMHCVSIKLWNICRLWAPSRNREDSFFFSLERTGRGIRPRDICNLAHCSYVLKNATPVRLSSFLCWPSQHLPRLPRVHSAGRPHISSHMNTEILSLENVFMRFPRTSGYASRTKIQPVDALSCLITVTVAPISSQFHNK